MKKQIIKLQFAVLLMVICNTVMAQPNWTVNPNQYVYSMTLTGKVVIDGVASVDENDMVAAFINGQCHGVTYVSYQQAIDEYFVFLMIYNNDPTGNITLKIYDASSNAEIEVTTTINFEVNGIVGSVSTPYNFNVETQAFEAKILSFTVPNQIGNTTIGSNTVNLTVPADTDRQSLKPTFVLSDGAKAYVNNILQNSGSSSNDFRSSVNYRIVPQVGKSKNYTVTVGQNSNSSTRISLSASSVPENTEDILVGRVVVSSNTLGNSYSLKLVNASGTNNDMFYLDGMDLYAKGPFNYENKSIYKINLKVDNHKGVAMQQLFSIYINDQNDPPTKITLSSNTLSETTIVNKCVARISVEDEDVTDIHTLDFKFDSISFNNNDLFSILGDSLILKKELSENVEDSVIVSLIATDLVGESIEKSWCFSLVDINYAPLIESTPLNYVIQNQVYVYSLQVGDNEGDALTISFENLPDWLEFDEITYLLSGVPNNDDVGLVQFTVNVSDGFKTTSQQVVISVLNINDAPEIKFYPPKQIFWTNRDNLLHLPENCIVDPDTDDTLYFSLSAENNSALPAWLNFNADSLRMSGKPSEKDIGEYSLKLTAMDDGRLKECVVFLLSVQLPTALEEIHNSEDFELFPNPVQSEFVIRFSKNEPSQITIYNVTGQQMKNLEFSSFGEKRISVADLESGVYFIRIKQGKQTLVERIIKE